jgi:hypothetical protein
MLMSYTWRRRGPEKEARPWQFHLPVFAGTQSSCKQVAARRKRFPDGGSQFCFLVLSLFAGAIQLALLGLLNFQ